MKVVCLQIDVKFGQPELNFKRVEEQIAIVSRHKPDIIVLPELWTTGYDLDRLNELADDNGMETKKFLAKLAESTM